MAPSKKEQKLAEGILKTENSEVFKCAPIFLKLGEHSERHRGFGFTHIWKEHFKEISDPQEALCVILKKLNEIITKNAEIYYEGQLAKKFDRCTVKLKSKNFVIILEKRSDYYSIITCYPTRKVNGKKEGAVSDQANFRKL